jgi:hypothetical protein
MGGKFKHDPFPFPPLPRACARAFPHLLPLSAFSEQLAENNRVGWAARVWACCHILLARQPLVRDLWDSHFYGLFYAILFFHRLV